MSSRNVNAVIFLGVVLSVLAGCVPSAEMKLNLEPKSETVYKVFVSSTKDYQFVQPSINKTKERHTEASLEMVFSQQVESVDRQGNATADITIKQLKYLSMGPEGVKEDFDSEREQDKSKQLAKLIGIGYRLKISPKGEVSVLDSSAARSVLKDGQAGAIATNMFSDEEIARRHQVKALFDADKSSYKKGDKWSSLADAPPGTLVPKTFEKVYTLTDLKEKDGQKIATVEMNAVPSSKRLDDQKQEQVVNFFSSMFDEKNDYTGKMVVNLTTGVIESYQEDFKVEWLAVEPAIEQKGEQEPDHLTMAFTQTYSIEKVN
ncbi:MAG: hypothetical protein CVV39_05820 [Planctomycetes bacterium HGW-Planctomycetes-1]|nr:MAG: hypothetical protein CVV39_05820 [Planctomycetes bacterium HGW-Planctomycetes-1]